MIELLSKLIKNRCINSGSSNSGNEIKSAETLKEFFKKNGLESEIIISRKKRASISLYLESKHKNSKTITLMSHLDVVPATKENWDFNPFCGEVKNGYMLGRGTVDMLGFTASMAQAVVDISKTDFKYNIRFLALADEEAEGIWGAQWLLKNRPELFKTDLIVSELGGFKISVGEKECIGVSFAEKGVARVTIKTFGKSGHASMPYKSENAITKLCKVVTKLEKKFNCVEITKEYKTFVKNLPLPEKIKKDLLNIEKIDSAIEEVEKENLALAKYLYGASRITVSAGIISGGTIVNVIPDSASVALDFRLPIGINREKFIEILNEKCPKDTEYKLTEFTAGNSSSLKSEEFKQIKKVYKKLSPKTPIVPIISSGVSDARFWRGIKVPAYGCTLFSNDIDINSYSTLLHGKNEQISLASLENMYSFFYTLLET